MACYSRPSGSTGKMGKRWTQGDVLAYKIKVVYEDLETFFGVTGPLPPPNVETDPDTADKVAATIKSWLPDLESEYRATGPDSDSDVWPDNRVSTSLGFVRPLFDLLRYQDISPDMKTMTSVLLWHKLRFLESHGRPSSEVDACVIDDDHSILFVLKVDRHLRGSDPEARLFSEAIAAFHNDNNMRAKISGTAPLTSKVMPGIVMDVTMPTFYKIPITSELVTAVGSGERPERETIVRAYRPEVPRPGEGMRPLENRSIILSCLEAFKRVMSF